MTEQIKHLRELCESKRIEYGQLYDLVLNEMDLDGQDSKLDKATVHKWLNDRKIKGISDKYIKYIAAALDVPEEELKLGRTLELDESKRKEIEKELVLNQQEKNKLIHFLYWSKYYLRLFSFLCALIGVFLFNATFWKNAYIYLTVFVMYLVMQKYDEKRYFKETKSKKITLKESVKNSTEFIAFIFKKESLSRIVLLVMMFICFAVFLPVLESLFYRGTFYISGTVFLSISLILFIESVFRK